MTDEFMASVQKMVTEAIEKQADNEEEMQKCKGEIVGRIVNGLRVVKKYDTAGRELTIQIVLKGE